MKTTTKQPNTQDLEYIGIDVAKKHLDVDLHGKVRQYDNTDRGVRKLLAELPATAHLVVEATGHYHTRLLHAAHEVEVFVSVVNPAWIKSFRKSGGKRAKTDEIDAPVITAYARFHRPKPTLACSESVALLRQLQAVRDSFISQRVELENQLEGITDRALCRMLKAQIKTLRTKCRAIEERMEKTVETDEDLKTKSAILRANKGVGSQCAQTLLCQMPELGTMDRKGVAALAGLAPYNNDSGKFRGKRRIGGGRSKVRKVLYMAALSATRYNPTFAALKSKMKAEGKAGKVILIAVARRLLVVLNAQIRDHLEQQNQPA